MYYLDPEYIYISCEVLHGYGCVAYISIWSDLLPVKLNQSLCKYCVFTFDASLEYRIDFRSVTLRPKTIGEHLFILNQSSISLNYLFPLCRFFLILHSWTQLFLVLSFISSKLLHRKFVFIANLLWSKFLKF